MNDLRILPGEEEEDEEDFMMDPWDEKAQPRRVSTPGTRVQQASIPQSAVLAPDGPVPITLVDGGCLPSNR